MNNETVLGLSKTDKIILIIVPPLLGGVIGWFLPVLAGWASNIPFMPFGGPLEWISGMDSVWVPVIAALVGLVIGIIFTLYVFGESLELTVTDYELKLRYEEREEHLRKKEISAVFAEGKRLIILGDGGRELFHGEIEAKSGKLATAFRQHGYPWTDSDPYEQQYIRWVAGHPDFPAHINALLAARERALEEEESQEIRTLRKDLAKSGIIVRDEGKNQYVRSAGAENK